MWHCRWSPRGTAVLLPRSHSLAEPGGLLVKQEHIVRITVMMNTAQAPCQCSVFNKDCSQEPELPGVLHMK